MIKEIDPDFLEKIYIEANKDGLSHYLFKYENNFYTIEWNGIKWGTPRMIKLLELEEENIIEPITYVDTHMSLYTKEVYDKLNQIINVINTKLIGIK
jgi:hypothetical protein